MTATLRYSLLATATGSAIVATAAGMGAFSRDIGPVAPEFTLAAPADAMAAAAPGSTLVAAASGAPAAASAAGGPSSATFTLGNNSPACVVDPRATTNAADATIPQNLCVPAASTDEKSVLLVWRKPDSYANVVDYRVYINKRDIGTAEANADANSPAKPYFNKFYQTDTANFHVKARTHNFLVTGLAPNTSYSFQVRAVHADGSMSPLSTPIIQATTPVPITLNVTDARYGAVGNGTTLNTVAIQAAIDACPAGCKVLIPAGVFKSGALFLRSNMTLEIAQGATLLGSASAADYPLAKGYVLYSYVDPNASNKQRPPSLINALDPTHREAGTFENIRIVGKGTIDGNGWKRTAAGSITDENGGNLPQYIASSANNVGNDGILAADQVAKARAADPTLSLADAYSNRRSSLMTLRGVRNLYVAGVTVLNPAYHGIMNLETENVAINAVVHKTYDTNNGDGIEFGNSNNAMVLNNFLDTGDDNVNFAAGQGAQAATLNPQRNAWIFNNYYREGHGAVAAGSHTGAFIENILAEDNVLFHTDIALRLKSTPQTGGGTRNIVFRDNAVRDASTQPFIFTLAYTAGGAVDFDVALTNAGTLYSNIVVQNVSVSNFGFTARPAIVVDGIKPGNADGYPETYHTGFVFDTVKLDGLQKTNIDHLRNSNFNAVTVTRPSQAAPFWVCTSCIAVTFTGGTTLP